MLYQLSTLENWQELNLYYTIYIIYIYICIYIYVYICMYMIIKQQTNNVFFFHTSVAYQKEEYYSISVWHFGVLSLSKTFYSSQYIESFYKFIAMLFLSYKLITSKFSIQLKNIAIQQLLWNSFTYSQQLYVLVRLYERNYSIHVLRIKSERS